MLLSGTYIIILNMSLLLSLTLSLYRCHYHYQVPDIMCQSGWVRKHHNYFEFLKKPHTVMVRIITSFLVPSYPMQVVLQYLHCYFLCCFIIIWFYCYYHYSYSSYYHYYHYCHYHYHHHSAEIQQIWNEYGVRYTHMGLAVALEITVPIVVSTVGEMKSQPFIW